MPSPTNKRTAIASLAISAAALVGIAANEGYVGTAYKDVVGVPTIGFGETAGVKMGQSTTPVKALQRLNQRVKYFGNGIEQCVHVPLYQYEYDAYLDLTYNIGVKNFCGSTLVSKLNAGEYSAACKQILRWNRAGGRPQPGLTKRRRQEYKTCIGAAR